MLPILFAQSVMRSAADDSHEINNRHHITVVYRERYLHPPREQVFLFYLVSSLLTHQFNQSNDTITMKASSIFNIQC